MQYIPRAMEATFLRFTQEYPVILLTGPRQVGKTTMLRELAKRQSQTTGASNGQGKQREYVTLDDLNERELAKNDPKMFLQIHKAPVLIDEVQYAPELFPYIKIHVDTHGNAGDFWLTGSQVFKLMDGVQESLAGRVCLLHMSTLSQAEMCGVSSTPFAMDFEALVERIAARPMLTTPELFQRIWTGGMPAIASGRYKDRNMLYSSYMSTYVERDIKELSGTIDSLQFLQFFTAAAALAGQMLNYKTIADASDISQVTAKKWLGILERLGIIFYLHPYSNNTLKRTVTKPKLYFYDTALVAYLTKWSDSTTLMNGAMNGAILENFTVSEVLKSYHNSGIVPYIYYYRDKDTKEIDIILERDGTLYPLEVKKTASPDKRLTKVFSVIGNTNLKRGTSAILCMADRLSAFDRDNLIVPIWGI